MARDDVSTVLSTLSLRQKLLLAQAVHQVGTQDWSRVSALLLQHPLVKREPGVATAGGDAAKKAETIEEDGKEKEREKYGAMLAQTLNAKGCEQAWSALMLQQGIVDPPADSQTASNGASPAKSAEDGATPKQDKKAQLALAQSLYAERLEELRAQILEKEERFR